MNKLSVSETELREYDEAGAITAAKVVRTVDGYVLVINVNWKEGDLTVFSQRHRPRVWVSLDRMIGRLTLVAPNISDFQVFLHPEGNST